MFVLSFSNMVGFGLRLSGAFVGSFPDMGFLNTRLFGAFVGSFVLLFVLWSWLSGS